MVFKNLADNSRVLEVLNRYEVTFDRQFSRALSLLLKLRAQSPQPPAPVPAGLSPLTCGTFEDAPATENTALPNEPNPTTEHPTASVISIDTKHLSPRSECDLSAGIEPMEGGL
jgi:hypothetical protein